MPDGSSNCPNCSSTNLYRYANTQPPAYRCRRCHNQWTEEDHVTPGLGIPLHVEHVTFAGGVRELEAHLDELRQRARADEAEMAAAGWRFLSIAHGDPETQQHVDALTQVARTFWAQPTRGLHQIAGGNDYTTYRAGPPVEDAEQVIAATRAVAEEHNPGHWHITLTAHPDFGWGPVP